MILHALNANRRAHHEILLHDAHPNNDRALLGRGNDAANKSHAGNGAENRQGLLNLSYGSA